MVPLQKNSFRRRNGLNSNLWQPQNWEAPDRKFVGHRDILTRSLARYHFILPYMNGALLEVGCGRGYGFEVLLAKKASPIGVDLSLPFLREALEHFRSIPFIQASGDAPPFLGKVFDSIVAFEVIEHIPDDRAFLQGLVRLIRKGGFVGLSTPNRRFVSGNASQPLDPFHVREYTSAEFYEILKEFFPSVILYGQSELPGKKTSSLRFIDRIPVRLKYLLPAFMQGILSVTFRTPLRIEDCCFTTEGLEAAHTFVALCHV